MNNATLSGFRYLAGKNDDLTADQIRNAVMAYLHYTGENHDRLSRSQWEGCWFLADGFGKQMDRKFAEEQCWDWSHIRDSSEEALERIWQVLCHWHNRGQLKPQCDR